MATCPYYIDIAATDGEDYEDGVTPVHRVYLPVCEPDEEDLASPERGWNGVLSHDPEHAFFLDCETWPYSVKPIAGDPDEGDLRILTWFRRKRRKFLVGAHTARLAAFYLALDGFTEEEIDDYGFVTVFSPESPLEVVLDNWATSRNTKRGTRTATFILRDINLVGEG